MKFPRATRLLLGFAGPKDEAEEIKDRLRGFLHDQLKLELSPEKTLITHAVTEKARFLGYDISSGRTPGLTREGPWEHHAANPIKKLEEKVARYTGDGRAVHSRRTDQ